MSGARRKRRKKEKEVENERNMTTRQVVR